MSFQSAWNAKFQHLPTLQVLPVITDEEREFQSDIAYMRDLLDAIIIQAEFGGHCGPWPDDIAYDFAWLESQVSDV